MESYSDFHSIIEDARVILSDMAKDPVACAERIISMSKKARYAFNQEDYESIAELHGIIGPLVASLLSYMNVIKSPIDMDAGEMMVTMDLILSCMLVCTAAGKTISGNEGLACEDIVDFMESMSDTLDVESLRGTLEDDVNDQG
jgi:hypothetical protein